MYVGVGEEPLKLVIHFQENELVDSALESDLKEGGTNRAQFDDKVELVNYLDQKSIEDLRTQKNLH